MNRLVGCGMLIVAGCTSPAPVGDVTEAADTVVPRGWARWIRGMADTPASVPTVASGAGGEALYVNGGDDVVAVRYDVFGRVEWSRSYGGPLADTAKVKASGDGGFILYGDGYPEICGPRPTAADDFVASLHYVAKIDAGGDCVWQHWLAPSFFSQALLELDVAPDVASGEVAVAGRAFYGLVIDGTEWIPGVVDDVPSPPVFLARIGALGAVTDARSLALDAGRILATGHDSGDVILAGFTDDVSASFVTRVSPSGASVWSRSFANAVALHVASGGSGDIALFGVLRGPVDFGNSSITPLDPPGHDELVLKLDADGVDLWSRHIWGTATYAGDGGVAVDDDGWVFVSMAFWGGSFHLTPAVFHVDGLATVVVARLGTATGSTVWATPSSPTGLRVGPPVITPDQRRVLAAGLCGVTFSFGGYAAPLVMASAPAAFVMRVVR